MTLVKFSNGNKAKALNPFFNDVFESFFNDSLVSDRMMARVPAVNIAETDGKYCIELAAPGLKKEDFKINLEENQLTISAETSSENAEENKKYSRREYSYRSFVRSFTLPDTADYNKIDAEYTDGILKINVDKKEEAKIQPRQIAIK